MTHAHSLIAYREEHPKLGARAQRVLEWIRHHGPATDRQVMHGLGFTDMNAVRPRCTELIEVGLLVEVGSRRCSVTGKKVRVLNVDLASKGESPLAPEIHGKAPKMRVNACKWCGGPIGQSRPWQEFCGDQCRFDFHNEQRRTKHDR